MVPRIICMCLEFSHTKGLFRAVSYTLQTTKLKDSSISHSQKLLQVPRFGPKSKKNSMKISAILITTKIPSKLDNAHYWSYNSWNMLNMLVLKLGLADRNKWQPRKKLNYCWLESHVLPIITASHWRITGRNHAYGQILKNEVEIDGVWDPITGYGIHI